jgi:hypothetical protein
MSGVFQGLIAPSLLISALFGGAAAFGWIPYEKLVFLNVWFLSVPHTFATFFRSDLRTSGRATLAVLVFSLLLVLCIAFRRSADLSVLILVYFFAQQFHYSRQNYGFSRMDNAVEGRSSLETVFYPGVAMISVLGALSKGPINFFGFAVKNPLPFEIPAWATGLTLSCLMAGILLFRPRDRWPHALMHFILNVALFWFSNSFVLVWFAINVLHNFQYLLLMIRVERSVQILAFPYLLSFGLALIAGLPEMILVFISINFTHYLWDARIWRGVDKLLATR